MCRYGVWDMKLGLTQTLKLRFEGVPPCLLLIFYPIITELGSLMFDCTMIIYIMFLHSLSSWFMYCHNKSGFFGFQIYHPL